MKQLKTREAIAFFAGLLSILVVQGAIPFVLSPTLGQAVWTAGFAQSIANQNLFSIYGINFGAPEPAPMAFGLSGAMLASIFIRLGMHAVDAYAAMALVWLTLAYYSAYALARHFSVARYPAVLAAVCWGTMPVIWAHSGYSMLSLGIGLLSFYFLATIRLMESLKTLEHWKMYLALYPCAAVIAVFMDGYSFMMFAVGSSMIIATRWIGCRDMVLWKRWGWSLLPVHAISFLLAYILYASYLGRTGFNGYQLDFFRGWGVDLAFMVVPTQGVHWLPDLLGWSVPRDDRMFWGDASVWATSFSLPLILTALWAVLSSRKCKSWLIAVSAMALFGFYMALGPSLKINAVKPPAAVGVRVMEERYAIAPTGSALLSRNLPGFSVMRASYRWGALGIFGAWLLIVFALSASKGRRNKGFMMAMLLLITFFNLPHPGKNWLSKEQNRAMFFQLDTDVLEPLSADVSTGQSVVFLPWRNDFLVNYLASKLNIVSYNVGGDKNFQLAREHWPSIMREFPMGQVDSGFADRILRLLAERDADVVILPYIDMLWAAHRWPHPESAPMREQIRPALEQLAGFGLLEISERDHYVAARLRSDLTALPDEPLKSLIFTELCLHPKCLNVTRFDERTPTRVGELREGRLTSTGEAGFLIFGPYQPMDAGIYMLKVYGSGFSTHESWLDVVSEKGILSHGRWFLDEIIHEQQDSFTVLVELEEGVTDLEVRLYVGAQGKFELKGYVLKPL